MDDEVKVQLERIDQAVEKNYNANLNQSAPPPPRARGAVGRPRKDGQPNKAQLRLIKDAIEKGAPENPFERPSEDGGASPEPEFAAPEQTMIELTDDMMGALLNFPFNIAKRRTGCEKLGLDEETQKLLVPQAQRCIRLYAPKTESKYAPLFMLCATFGMVAAGQRATYLAWKSEQDEKKAAAERLRDEEPKTLITPGSA